MHHTMSPTGVAALLLLALVTDYLSVGPTGIRDRLAFLMAVAAIREGFNGSPLDAWTVTACTNIIDRLKAMSDGAYIAGASTQLVLGVAIGVLAIYTLGLLLPKRWSKKLGRFAAVEFARSDIYRINYPLWACAFALGLMSDLAQGSVGMLVNAAMDFDISLMASIPFTLFGVS
jgi:hypothetical protein